MNPPLLPEEMYGVAKHRAITLAMMLEDMAKDVRLSDAARKMFAEAGRLVDGAVAILRDVPFVVTP